MEGFVKGEVIVLSFPFTDLSGSKNRPALVLAVLEDDDIIMCQITSKARRDKYAVQLDPTDFVHGRLNVSSNIRPNKLFTGNKKIVQYKIGSLKMKKIKEVEETIIRIFKT